MPQLVRKLGEIRVAEGIRSLQYSQPFASPKANRQKFELYYLLQTIELKATKFQRRGSIYDVARKHEHVALIYKAMISPAGLWLVGPELETKNRVLRKYPNDLQYFLRVIFCDEDGEQLRREGKVNRDAIFDKFKGVLNDGISLFGRRFTFLGFSNSSLRTQSCWFMSTFW